MSATHISIERIAQLLERLDPQDDGACDVAGCRHDDHGATHETREWDPARLMAA